MDTAKRYFWTHAASLAALAAFGSGFAVGFAPPQAAATETAATAEKNPPGDIPDSQVFVVYRSPLGFSLKVPEGWARSERKNGAKFADKFNTIDIEVGNAAAAPSVDSVKADQVAELVRTDRAVKIVGIKGIKLPAGDAVLIVYQSNSDPNPVTRKQLRQENNRYLLFRDGRLAALDLAAPLGADNVDQWQLIARSFRWE